MSVAQALIDFETSKILERVRKRAENAYDLTQPAPFTLWCTNALLCSNANQPWYIVDDETIEDIERLLCPKQVYAHNIIFGR